MKKKSILTGVLVAAAFLVTLIDSLDLLPRTPAPGEIPGGGRPEPLAAVVAALIAAAVVWVLLQIIFAVYAKLKKKEA